MSDKIKLSNGVTLISQEVAGYQFSGAYSENELRQYFENLQKTLQKTPSDFAFAFYHGSLSLDLFYDASLRQWQLIEHDKITKTFQSNDEIIRAIQDKFPLASNNVYILLTSIYGIENKNISPIIAASTSSQQWKAIQAVTSEKAGAKTQSGDAWIHMAARLGETDIVESLIKKGADPNQFDKYLRSPLHRAALSGNHRTVQSLLMQGANPNLVSEPDRETALHVAKAKNFEEIINTLSAHTDPLLKFPKVFNSQDWLIKRLELLGYPVGEAEGICLAIAHMAMQAVLTDELEKFEERIKMLYLIPLQKCRDFKASKGLISLTGDKQKDIDLLAFCDGIEIYQNSYKHKHLLEPSIDSGDWLALNEGAAALVSSVKLDNDKIIQLPAFSGVYTLEELEVYLKKWEEHILAINSPFSLILGQSSHDTELSYDRKRQTWCFVDANGLPVQRTKDIKELAKMIQKGLTFLDDEKSLVPMITRIKTTESNKQKLSQCVESWKQETAIKKMHEVTFEKARFILESSPGEYDSWLLLTDECGEFEKAKQLVAYGADIYLVGFNKQTAVTLAAARKDADMVLLLSFVNTPHLFASAEGYVDILQDLIRHGEDIKKRDVVGKSALHYAAQNGRTDVIRVLIENGFSLEQVDNNQQTALQLACKNGQIEAVKYLIESGADFSKVNQGYASVFHWAAAKGHVDIVKLLIKKGVDIHQEDQHQKTAAQLASEHQHAEIVSLLTKLSIESDISTLDSVKTLFGGAYTRTELQTYFKTLEESVVYFANNPCLNLKSPNESLSLYYDRCFKKWHLIENDKVAQEFSTTEEMIEKIQKTFSKSPNESSVFITRLHKIKSDKRILSMIVRWNSRTEFYRELHKVNPESAGAVNNGFSWLHAAAKLDEEKTVVTLVENGAEIDLMDPKGRTALYYAIKNRNTELVEFLLSKGADPNLKSGPHTEGLLNEITPLELAVLSDEVQMVKALLVNNISLETLQAGIKIAKKQKEDPDNTEMEDIIALIALRLELELRLSKEVTPEPHHGLGFFHSGHDGGKAKAAAMALKEVFFGSSEVSALSVFEEMYGKGGQLEEIYEKCRKFFPDKFSNASVSNSSEFH